MAKKKDLRDSKREIPKEVTLEATKVKEVEVPRVVKFKNVSGGKLEFFFDKPFVVNSGEEFEVSEDKATTLSRLVQLKRVV